MANQQHLIVMYGTWSFKMRLLTFALNALWEEACSIENGSSFHTIGPEYVKVLVQSTELPSTSNNSIYFSLSPTLLLLCYSHFKPELIKYSRNITSIIVTPMSYNVLLSWQCTSTVKLVINIDQQNAITTIHINIKIVGKPMLDKFLTGENVKVND
jgi:hypothetical protein